MVVRRALLALAASCSSIVLTPAFPALGQATCSGDGSGSACLDALGGGVDDIFQTSDGRYAPELTFGTYVDGINSTGCCYGETTDATMITAYSCSAGYGTTPFSPTGDGRCMPDSVPDGLPALMDEAANSLDWKWTQVLRSRDDCAIVADGEPGHYVPWRGRIYDLGGEANRVVVFPITDHGPLPCEAFEYTLWLSNNPDALEVADPGAPDPDKWNPSIMIRAYNEGWTRNPNAEGAADSGRADLGTFLRDTSSGDAVADSTVTVFALPCGITFRYVSIQAGNNGNPTDACTFHSSDDELDTVAGLNEDDTAICLDEDMDGHRDEACGGGDCDDSDASVHPGAFEPCNAERDLDCQPDTECPEGTVCDDGSGLCVPSCFEGGCAEGFECVGSRCVDTACADREEPCPDGTICRTGECVDPCAGATCPEGEICRGGACIDPCAGVECPSNQVCIADDPDAEQVCGPSCACDELAEPLCPSDKTCDEREESDMFGRCVDPGCEVAECPAGERCAEGRCVPACAGVTCPLFQVCVDGECVADLCARVSCPVGKVCAEGECVSPCSDIECAEGEVCRAGECHEDPCAGVTCEPGERCVEGLCEGSGGDDAGTGDADGGGGDVDAGDGDAGGEGGGKSPGCACTAAGPARGALALLLLGAVVAIALGRRRRRR